jgi:ABC-type branched-subunit amino acid transport system substrate-binding protein
MRTRTHLLALCALTLALAACGKKVDDKSRPAGPGSAGTPAAGARPANGTAPAGAVPGVDPARKVISLGALNAETGPAKLIGVAYANGKRLVAKAVQAGVLKLPDGWTIELVERDHTYNPQQAVQLYKELQPKVLLFATSFGTQATLPLLEDLRRDDVLAFPASLSSELAKDEHTPPLGPSFKVEAMRAMDWAVEAAGGADKVKAGIVYQRDDYGADGVAGWAAAAEHHKVKIVVEQTVKPGDQDFTTVAKALKDAGANYVLLTVLPNHTQGLLGAAQKMQYAPVWLGNTAAWHDVFFTKLKAPMFETFHWITGLTYWGEDVPGMKEFLEVWKTHGAGMGDPDFYLLTSYVQGLVQLEVLKRAIEAKQLDRAGVRKALHSITSWDGGGLYQPLDLSKVPYVTSTRTHVLVPDFEKRSWKQVAGYAEPKTPLKD